MSSLEDLIDLIIYPLKKIFILLASIEVFGVSLLALLTAAIVISIIFAFFIGMHSINGGFVSNFGDRMEKYNKRNGNDE